MRKRGNKGSRKKGLSAVITTLVIILLVLFTSGIVWTTIKNLVTEGAKEISLGRFELDLDIKSVKVEGDDLAIGIRRNPGRGNIIGIKFVFENGTDSEIIEREVYIRELEEQSFIFGLSELSLLGIKKISIVPIYESAGKEISGDIVDIFELEKPIRGEAGKWEYLSNFAKLGFSGVGKVEYGPFSSSVSNLPEFRKAIVDPLDVLPGDNQTFTVHVYSPYSVITVTTTTELDNSILNLDLEEINEYEDNGENIEVYSASWIVNDVHTTTYRTTIIATDAKGNSNSITLTWTDSCHSQITHGGDDTLSTSCSTGINATIGLDGGNLTIASGVTLTIDSGSIWAFNSGESIILSGTATITVNGEIKKGYLFYPDSDGDSYRLNNSGLVFSSFSTLSNSVRAKDNLGNDCYDNNASANPDQTGYFSVNRGDGSWDYNCDGSGDSGSSNPSAADGVCHSYSGGSCPSIPNKSLGGVTGFTTSINCGSSGTFVSDPGGCFPPGPGESTVSCVTEPGTTYTCVSATKNNTESGVCHTYTNPCPDDPNATLEGDTGFTTSKNCGSSGDFVSDPGGCFPTPGGGGVPESCVTETRTQACR